MVFIPKHAVTVVREKEKNANRRDMNIECLCVSARARECSYINRVPCQARIAGSADQIQSASWW